MAATSQAQTVRSYFTILKMLPLVLIAGPCVFLLAVLAIKSEDLFFALDQLDVVFVSIVVAISLGALFVGNIIMQKQIQQAKSQDSLKAKTSAYLVANLVKFALLEGALLLAIAMTFLTGNLGFLVFWAFLVVIQLTSLPNKDKLIMTMDLSRKEIDILNNPDAILK